MTSSATKFVAVDGNNAGVTFIRPSELALNNKLGIVLEGIYEGSQPNQLDPSKSDYAFMLDSGKKAILNGTAGLTRQMEKVSTGELVQIEYLGKVDTKKGKTAHNFIVRRAATEE
jgi:hypothetical protein